MTQALFLSTLLLLSAAPAKTRSPGGAKLSSAQAEFNRGDFLGALKLLQAAEGETTDDATLARIQLLQGQCYGAQRDFTKAEERFAAALGHDPEVRLDPAKVDPDLVKILEALRDRLQGELSVQADKPSAKVYLDGKVLGAAPVVKSMVGIGKHQVEVRTTDGKYGASEDVVVRQGRSSELNLTLEERTTEVPERTSGRSSRGEARSESRNDSRSEPHADLEGNAPVVLGFGKPFADLRTQIDPFQYAEGVGIEVGGGLESQYLRFSGHFRVFPAFGLAVRGAFSVPVADQLRGYVSMELPVIFFESVAFGLGGEGGAEYLAGKWISVFAEVGARHFFITPSGYNDNRLTIQAGVRLRLP